MQLTRNFTHQLRFNRRNRIASIAIKMFNLFWDLILDRNPEYCFLCGKFISPSERQLQNIKKPYKNGDLCHESCWKLFVKMEHTTTRLSDHSELICHIDKGKNKTGKVCRLRVQNTNQEVYDHLMHHNVETDDELQFPFEYYRSMYFLKPDGKPFPKARGYP